MSSELREFFEMVTRQTEPESDAWWERERRQRRKSRNRRLGALAIAATIGIVAVVVSFVAQSRNAEPPVDEPTPRPTPATLGSLAYGLDGDIYVADWDGSNAVKIADGRPPTDCGASSMGEYFAEGSIWAPDGRYLAFRHTDCDRPLDGPWWDVVISDPQGNVVTSIASKGWRISWSPDSTRVAVWVRFGRTIGVYGPDGERQALLTVPRGILGNPSPVERTLVEPVWSPTGQLLLTTLNGIFEIPLDGTPPRRLRTEGGRTYSPDGSRVAYTTGRSLIIASADGSDPEEMFGDRPGGLNGPGARVGYLAPWPAWSPTGDRIAFTSGSRSRPSTELRVLDVATGTITLLTEWEGSEWISVLDFSPDGDRILFSRGADEAPGAGSLWSVNADGSDLRRLVAGTALGDWLSPNPTP